jgi:hypothetical protein
VSDTTRPCLVCDDAPELHDTDPATAEHVYEPEHPTPAEAATIVAWVAETHGAEAAHETAQNIADAEGGADSPVGKAAYAVAKLADEAQAAALVADLATDERAAIAADLAEGGWQLPAPQRGWVLTADEEAAIRNAQ